MSLYNKKIGFYTDYYNMNLISFLKTYNFFSNNLYNKNMNYCIITYPILYKKISFFRFSCNIVKQKRMKRKLNLNQTIILEGYISRNKCFLSVPVFSLINNIKPY